MFIKKQFMNKLRVLVKVSSFFIPLVFLLVAARCLELDETDTARIVIYVSSRIVANQI